MPLKRDGNATAVTRRITYLKGGSYRYSPGKFFREGTPLFKIASRKPAEDSLHHLFGAKTQVRSNRKLSDCTTQDFGRNERSGGLLVTPKRRRRRRRAAHLDVMSPSLRSWSLVLRKKFFLLQSSPHHSSNISMERFLKERGTALLRDQDSLR